MMKAKAKKKTVRYIPTPDAGGRLSRAIDILLRSAATDTAEAQDSRAPDAERAKPPSRAPSEDAPPGADGGDSHETG